MSNKNQMQPLSDAPSTLPKPLANFATTLLTRKTASVAQMNTQFKAYSYLPSPLDPLSQVVFSSKTKLLAHNISDLKNPEPIASSFKAMADNSIEEKLFNASSQIKILTSQISMHLDTKYRERLFSQIDALHALDEWDPDDKPIQVTSFLSRQRYQTTRRKNRCPRERMRCMLI